MNMLKEKYKNLNAYKTDQYLCLCNIIIYIKMDRICLLRLDSVNFDSRCASDGMGLVGLVSEFITV